MRAHVRTVTGIVPATERDFLDASRIVTAYFDAIGLAPDLRDRPEDLAAYLHEPGRMWLARRANRVVGVVGLRPLTAIADACEVKRLYVEPAHRRHGIASALLDAFESAAVALGYTVAYLDTRADLHAAIAFYERRGYAACERYNDNPAATAFMRRRLAAAARTDRQGAS